MYQVAGISKQAVHRYSQRKQRVAAQGYKLFEQADKLRRDHPRVGCRKLALDLRSPGWGRDKVEEWLLGHGYRVKYTRYRARTTQRQNLYHYPNLIEGRKINGIHRVIQTDITYYRVKDRFYYLTFLVDVYSRYIGGYAVSRTLEASANIAALKMLLRNRKGDHSRLIHHSDKGSQYIDKEYVRLLKANEISISMCDEAWENAYSERVNRTIKEEYLEGWSINSYEELARSVKKAIAHYNQKRRHQSLDWISPVEFENQLKQMPVDQYPVMKIYKKLEVNNIV